MKIQITTKGIDTLPWATLKGYERNILKGGSHDQSKLRASIERHGFAIPIFIWAGRKYILDGAGRCNLMERLESEGIKIPALPVVEVKAPTKRKAEELVAVISSQYGKVTEDSWIAFTEGWDMDKQEDFDLAVETFDFPGMDFGSVVGSHRRSAPGSAANDPGPSEPPKKPKTRRGDLYILGDHRLVCGDCTDQQSWDLVLGGACPEAMITDPPYGMGETRMRDGGDTSKENAAGEWDQETFDIRLLPVKKYKTLIWGAQFYGGAPLELGLMTWSVWDKKTYEMGSVRHGAHELACANFGKAKVWPIMWGPYQSMRNRVDHPTPKPVALVKLTVEHATGAGEGIVDPFAGGGSMFVACQELGRICFGIEKSPTYCDVIVDRWEKMTGKRAERIRPA